MVRVRCATALAWLGVALTATQAVATPPMPRPRPVIVPPVATSEIVTRGGPRDLFEEAENLAAGPETPEVIARRQTLYARALAGGIAEAAFVLANINGPDRSPATASALRLYGIALLSARTEQGDGAAAYLLARSYESGNAGGFPDPEAAAALYVRALELGEGRAALPLAAIRLASGRTRDAIHVLAEGARLGDGAPMRVLARVYRTGEGVPADPDIAAILEFDATARATPPPVE